MDLWGFSLHFWERIFFISTGIAAIAGSVSVIAACIAGVVGYQVTDRWQKDADLRIAEANARAKESELKLEQLRKEVGPRQLNRAAFLHALKDQPKAPVAILYLRDDPDSLEFAQEIENSLKAAKWIVISREVIPTPSGIRAGPEIPITMSVGGQPSGITVVARSVSEKESRASELMMRQDWETTDWVRTPWTVLSNAFLQSMGRSSSSSHTSVPEGTLRIVVGPRR